MFSGTMSPSPDVRVNDFSIQIATVNGSGSQTANNVLMRSVFQMGVPVSGKNLFPPTSLVFQRGSLFAQVPKDILHAGQPTKC